MGRIPSLGAIHYEIAITRVDLSTDLPVQHNSRGNVCVCSLITIPCVFSLTPHWCCLQLVGVALLSALNGIDFPPASLGYEAITGQGYLPRHHLLHSSRNLVRHRATRDRYVHPAQDGIYILTYL